MATWRTLIAKSAKNDTILQCTLTESELDIEFSTDGGGEEGIPFFAWSKDWVYFAACYDGSEWVARVPRNPETPNHAPYHIGGG